MPIVRMPDGQKVRFPDNMSREEIRGMILQKFPDAFERQQQQYNGLRQGLKPLTESQKAEAAGLAAGLRPQGIGAWEIAGEGLKGFGQGVVSGLGRVSGGATLGATDWLDRKTGGHLASLDADLQRSAESSGLGGWNKAAKFASELGGNIQGVGGALVKGLSKAGLKGLKLASASGGLEGAAYGATGSDSLDELPENVAWGAALGAALPFGLHYGAKGAKWAARPVTDKIVPTYKAAKSILDSKVKLNSLTFDPNLTNMQNIWKKVTGKGDTIDDVLNEENQRLARQSAREAKFVDARRTGNETQIRGYGSHPYSGELGEGINTGANGNVGLRLNRWSPNKHLEGVLESPLSFNEYDANPKNAQMFYDAMTNFKKTAGAKGEQVYQYSPEKYADMRTFLTDDGKTGFAIRNDGDIVSVFNGNTRAKGAGDAIMEAATSAGGSKLDAYDTFLPEIYSRHGFKEVGRDAWNEQFAPDRWDKKAMRKFNLGEPDVVYMEYDPAYYGNYQSPNSLQNVVNRLQNNIQEQKEAIKNIWRPLQSSRNNSINRSFVEALADENKRRTMRNAVMSGAEDLSERAKILSDRLERRNGGMYDADFEQVIKTPELSRAEEKYAGFMAKNGGQMMSEEKVADFYAQHPIAEDMIAEMRLIDPRAFDGIQPGSLAEFDMLKKTLREEAGNKVKVGASRSGALKRAENDLKTLMDREFPGFRDVNRNFADAQTTQDIFESRLKKGLTSVGGATVSPFWSGISSPLTAAGVVGGYFNPFSLAVTAGGLGGKALMRRMRRNAGRRLADGIVQTPVEVNINPLLSAGLSSAAFNNLRNR